MNQQQIPLEVLTIEQFIRLEMIKTYKPKTNEITHKETFDGDVRVFTQYILTGHVSKEEAINHYRSVLSPLRDETTIVQ